jgi:hypothetical protein
MQFERKIARKFFFVQLHCVYKKRVKRSPCTRKDGGRIVEPFRACTTNMLSPTSRAKRCTFAAVGTSFPRLTAVHARLVVIGAATASLALASCGGKSTPSATTTQASQPRPSAAELRWRRQVRAFAAALVSDLERVQAATGGGPKAGPVGARLDERVFVPGARRRSFLAALTALERCPQDVARAVPAPPSAPLLPARTALGNACAALASAAASLRDAVTGARSARAVDPGALDFARGRAQDGVRLVIDALAIVARAASTGSG